jgi:hypothetical protein
VSLGKTAKIAGFAWLSAGVIYGAWRTSFFRKPLDFLPLDADDEKAEPLGQNKLR